MLPLKKTEPTDPLADHIPEHIVHLPVWIDDDESHHALERPRDADIQEMQRGGVPSLELPRDADIHEMLASPLSQSTVEPVLQNDLVLAPFGASVWMGWGVYFASNPIQIDKLISTFLA